MINQDLKEFMRFVESDKFPLATWFTENDYWEYEVISDNKLCDLCEPFKGMVFQGHNLDRFFPYLDIINADKIMAHNHMPRDDNCRCYLKRVA